MHTETSGWQVGEARRDFRVAGRGGTYPDIGFRALKTPEMRSNVGALGRVQKSRAKPPFTRWPKLAFKSHYPSFLHLSQN